GEIDPDTADWRHGVRGIADEEQSGPEPLLQSIDAHREQLDVVPRSEIVRQPIPRPRDQLTNVFAELLQTTRTHGLGRTFGNDHGALPVVTAIDVDQSPAYSEHAQCLVRVPCVA